MRSVGTVNPAMPASAMFVPLLLAAASLLASTAYAQDNSPSLSDRGRIMVDGFLGGRWSSHPVDSLDCGHGCPAAIVALLGGRELLYRCVVLRGRRCPGR